MSRVSDKKRQVASLSYYTFWVISIKRAVLSNSECQNRKQFSMRKSRQTKSRRKKRRLFMQASAIHNTWVVTVKSLDTIADTVLKKRKIKEMVSRATIGVTENKDIWHVIAQR